MGDEDQRKIFSKNLNYYLSINSKTQREVADAIGVSPQTFNTWCQGIALPRMGKVQALADYFHIGKTDLIDEKTCSPLKHKRGVTINVLGRVAAGIPLEAIEEIVDTEEITEELASTGKFFGLRIKGDSMDPVLSEGDTVIVRQQNDADNGDTVIAMVNGSDAVCKRLKKYADSIMLLSNNPSYDPMIFSKQEILEKTVRIIGRVVELRRKF